MTFGSRTGFGLLAFVLLALIVLGWIAPELISRYVLLPRRADDLPALRVDHYVTKRFQGGHYGEYVPSTQRIAMRPGCRTFLAYGFWEIPRPGRYRIILEATVPTRLYIDGRPAIALKDYHSINFRSSKRKFIKLNGQNSSLEEAIHELAAGRHLVVIQSTTPGPPGWASLAVAEGANPITAAISGPSLRAIKLTNFKVWWALMRYSQAVIALGSVALGLLLLGAGQNGMLGDNVRHRMNKLLYLNGADLPHDPAPLWHLPGFRLLISSLIIIMPILLVTGSNKKAHFNSSLLENINRTAPDTVFIGNSMIASRLNADHYSRLNGNRGGHVLWIPGSGPREWYLLLKYSVLPAKVRPATVVMGFFNTELLNPKRGFESENHRERVEALTPSRTRLDPVFQQIALGRPDVRDQIGAQVRDRLNVGPLRYRWQDNLQSSAFHLSQDLADYQSILPPFRINVFYNRINSRLGLTHLRNDIYFMELEQKKDAAQYDLRSRLSSSFLPHIVSLCREAGIRLMIVRFKPRPNALGETSVDGPLSTAMIRELDAYLTAQGAHFLDLRHDPAITLNLFGGGHHLDWGAGQARWTEIYHRRSQHLMQ